MKTNTGKGGGGGLLHSYVMRDLWPKQANKFGWDTLTLYIDREHFSTKLDSPYMSNLLNFNILFFGEKTFFRFKKYSEHFILFLNLLQNIINCF